MIEALVAFGGNVGDIRRTLAQAIAAFGGVGARVVARSSDYSTPPWGVTNQPSFVNCCIAVETSLPPRDLLARALMTERQFGRDRATEQRWGPRPIDIDLLTYGQTQVNEPNLTLPHPRLLERAFVLVPLAEIRPDLAVNGVAINDALAHLDQTGIERLPRVAS